MNFSDQIRMTRQAKEVAAKIRATTGRTVWLVTGLGYRVAEFTDSDEVVYLTGRATLAESLRALQSMTVPA